MVRKKKVVRKIIEKVYSTDRGEFEYTVRAQVEIATGFSSRIDLDNIRRIRLLILTHEDDKKGSQSFRVVNLTDSETVSKISEIVNEIKKFGE